MQASSNPNSIIRFGVFEVDLQQAELRHSGLRQKLSPQTFEVLRAMLERPGELITREDLRERLWPGNTTVDYELGLKKCINRIREVLGDSSDHPRFVETVPRRGYRFVASIQEHEPTSGTGFATEKISTAPADTHNDRDRQPDRTAKRPKKVLLAGVLVAVIALVSTWRLRGHGSNGPNSNTVSSAAVLLPLTIEGDQRLPALSPDGSRVVFLRSDRLRTESGLYAAVVGSQSSVRLTQSGEPGLLKDEKTPVVSDPYSPAWSPDGREVAFLRDRGDKFLIETVPALGGAERTIYAGSRSPLNYETGKGGLSFSPDGNLLAFAEWNATIQRSFIKVLSLRDSSTRVLTSPPPASHDRRPAFSPGGDKLAFIRSSGPTSVEELFVISVAGGEPKQLTFDHKQISGPPAWTQTDEIVFSSSRGGLPTIWRVAASGGIPQRVPEAGPVAWYPSLSQSGNELAYEYVDQEQNLWRLELNGQIHASAPASILVSSAKTQNMQPQFSPDGHKIAFQSSRSGYPEVWICNSDGSHAVQVTDLHGFAGSPRFSPDGRYLAFDYRSQHRSDVYVIETDDRHPHPVVAFPDADSFLPSWSRDGRWIYFTSNRGEKVYQIWKQSVKDGAAAGPPPTQVTRDGGFGAVETVDGKLLLYTKPSGPGIWAMPANGGAETRIWGGPGPDNWSNWAVTQRGIYFFVAETGASQDRISRLQDQAVIANRKAR
jgi:Tol biopolymer transport system component/DNA-binding winged helix-turn-helix (wHTH) protein